MSEEIHVHVNCGGNCGWKSALEQMQTLFLSALAEIKQQGVNIMTKISDFATAQADFNTQQGTAIDAIGVSVTGLTGDIQTLNDKITELQNSAGAISPADQALLDDLQAQGAALAAKVQAAAAALAALDALTPPAVPTGP